jgi:hypothetical protein
MKLPFQSSTLLLLVIAAFTLGSCGPELTTPASTDVSGTWVSPGPAAGMTSISVTLTQTSDGRLTGTYAVIGTPGLQFCPATGPCAISGTVQGTNTVLEVFFYLTDSGTFTGQLLSDGTLKGAMARTSATDPVQFTRQ